MTIVNNGPGVARGVSVVDVLPDGVDFVSNEALPAGTTFSQDGGVDNDGDDSDRLTYDLTDLSPGNDNARTITLNVSLDDGVTGDLINTATVDTTDIDTDATNDTDTVTVNPGLAFDLTITKTVNEDTVIPGDTTTPLVYTITVTNDAASPSTAPNVRVTDVIPAGLTAVSVTAAGGTSSFDSTTRLVTVDYASLAPGASMTFTIDAAVQSSATGNADGDDTDTDADDIVNTANVTSTTNAADETDTTNNSATADTDLTPQFDLVVTKTLDATEPDDSFGPGEDVAFTVTVQNDGPSDSGTFALSDPIPTGLTFVSATIGGTAATLVGGVPTFANLQLDSGDDVVATFNYTVDADATGTITNTASVPNDIDNELDDTNNSASDDINFVPAADVQVVKTVDQTTADPGDRLTYTIVVTNNGPSPAADVTITDDLPAGVTFVSATGPGNTALTPNAAGDIVFDGGTLASTGTFTVTVIADINADSTGTITNPVTVATTTIDTNAANNSAQAQTVIDPPDPETSTISGTVYVDTNNNGIQDAGEVGIAGVALALTGTDTDGNAITRDTTTDANGDYQFENLPAGTFAVNENPAGRIPRWTRNRGNRSDRCPSGRQRVHANRFGRGRRRGRIQLWRID